jgi:ribosomal protein S18 acetylase RimI-like enzyme
MSRLWAAVRASHAFSSQDEFERHRAAYPWAVRVSERGDALVLSVWREHLDILAVTGVWAPDERVAALIDDILAVARSRGYGRVMSPLMLQGRSGPYRAKGFEDLERLVAYTRRVTPDDARERGVPAHPLREAVTADVGGIVSMEAECFDEYWRHGDAEVLRAIESDEVMVALAADGRSLAGVAICGWCDPVMTIGRLAVAPHARRSGVARALLVAAIARAGRRGMLGISLCTQRDNEPARALYESMGFTAAPDDHRILVATVAAASVVARDSTGA